MEPGELEMRKVFEDTTTQNVKTIIQYSTDTRAEVRKLEEKIVALQSLILQRDEDIKQFRAQLATVQAKVYASGT